MWEVGLILALGPPKPAGEPERAFETTGRLPPNKGSNVFQSQRLLCAALPDITSARGVGALMIQWRRLAVASSYTENLKSIESFSRYVRLAIPSQSS